MAILETAGHFWNKLSSFLNKNFNFCVLIIINAIFLEEIFMSQIIEISQYCKNKFSHQKNLFFLSIS